MFFSCGISNDFIANTNHKKPIVLTAHKLIVLYKTPIDTYHGMRQKAYKYINDGYQLVWLVYPTKRIVEVVQPDNQIDLLVVGDILDGGDVLPGFRLAVETLFS